MHLQGVLLHDHLAPDALQQLVLTDEISAALHQSDEQVEGMRAEVNGRRRMSARGAQRVATQRVQTGNAPRPRRLSSGAYLQR